MKRRIGGIFLALALCLTLLPTAARAADGQPAIQAGLGSITGYSTENGYNYIYYGTWQDKPIKWRVLDTKTNTGKTGALFLLTDECLYPLNGSSIASYISFNDSWDNNKHLWKDSTLQSWFKNTFYEGENTAFTDAERALISEVTQANSEYEYKPSSNAWDPAFIYQTGGLEAEYVFAPSVEEICKADYGFATVYSRVANPITSEYYGTQYWIRSYTTVNSYTSQGSVKESLPAYVDAGGGLVTPQYAGGAKAAVRPAMNLRTDSDNILFISAAEGGKPDGGLKAVSAYDGSEWKLTLKDSSRSSFSVSTESVSTTNYGGDITISYSGAKTGSNEYIAVMLKDTDGNPIWYGRSSTSLNTESGTVTIPVAAGLTADDYILYVYNEQYNGDKKTDYASNFEEVPLTVKAAATYAVTYNPGENGTGTEFKDTKIEGFPLNLADKSKAFTRTGYTQTGWSTVEYGEKDYDLGAIYEKNEAITLYPVWTANRYTVTLDTNGGDAVTPSKVTVVYNENCPTMPVPQYMGYVFNGWFDQQYGGNQYGDKNGLSTAKYDKTADCILYAQWQEAPDCTVTFDPNGGTLAGEATSSGKQNAPVGKPADPTRAGYTFTGWYTDAACTQAWNFSDWLAGNMTLYAGWSANSYAITYDLDGGTTGENPPVSHTYGTPTVIPTPTRSGYTFAGWLVNDNTDAVKDLTLGATDYTSDISLKATWTVISSGGSYTPTYPVNTPGKAENGSVSVSPKNAPKGDTVTITVKPDSGYVLETISATDKNGNDLKLTDKGDGKYTFVMPAGKVEVAATFMEDNSLLNFFYDVPNGAYYYEAVKWAVENGVTGGIGNNLFGPDQPCTRAQIVTFLWRAAGSPELKAMSSFSDVPADSYYAKAVAWAVENGITTGTSAETFSPDATCTRAQAVTFLARALNAKASGKAEFSDVPVDSYFAEAVAWAASNGVTTGIGSGLFGPNNNCTRAQIVTFLWRAYRK